MRHVSLAAIARHFASADTKWVILAVVAVLASSVVGACNLLVLINRDRSIRIGWFLPMYWTSWAVGLVVPGQIGDVASITMLLAGQGHDWPAILSRSILDKIVSFVVFVGFACFGFGHYSSSVRFAGGAILAVLLCVSGILCLVWKWSKRGGFDKGRIGMLALQFDHIVSEFIRSATKSPSRLLFNGIGTTVKFAMTGMAYWAIFRGFGQNSVTYFEVLPLVAATSLVAYVPISFNGIGTVEMAGVWLFSSIGLSASTVISSYVLLRGSVFLLAWIPSGIWLLTLRGKREGKPFSARKVTFYKD